MMLLGITFSEFIQKINVIIGIGSAILGVATWILGVNIAKAYAEHIIKTIEKH